MALEMTMRNVLGNMEELISEYGFHEVGGDFAIIAIERGTVPIPGTPAGMTGKKMTV